MSSPATARTDFFARHEGLLRAAAEAIATRGFHSAYPESPSKSVYGEEAPEAGERAFRDLLDRPFALPGHPGEAGAVGGEVSPYGPRLGVTYPRLDPREAVATAKAAGRAWRRTSPDTRAGVAAEILARLNAASFQMAHAVHHTTGQPFVMAFQAGGANAQDRGLEAVAYAWTAQRQAPAAATWAKPTRKGEPLTLEKTFTPVGRGVSLLIACNTFPTWNGYPGLFASLVTGNPVVVKPHPAAVLPLALSVRVARDVLAEAGFDPNTVLLAAEAPEDRVAATLATDPDVRIIDFTGSTGFGDWLEQNARQAAVHTEKAGLNTVVLDSTADYKGLLRNLAFSLSLYSGQMCTTPQNLYVPREGLATDQGVKTPEVFAADLADALGKLLGDPQRAAGTLGALTGEAVRERVDKARALGGTQFGGEPLTHPEYPEAVLRTPLVAVLDADRDAETYRTEWFGPISFVIATDSTARAVELLRETIAAHGALTASVHSTDAEVLEATREAALDAGVHLAENFTGQVFVNQTAAFSDYHGSQANPAASATLSDWAFVTGRFAVLQSRRPAVATQEATGA
ncbi:phenylacetic acid degradation protein PaaN [Streptomyces sp. NPDC088674]|uniref:phenylacetic acid degradation protein PaaN n=1 Tax=Streptomyces sp. NPDC088674 TaxID=3365869 RepID=UPI0037F95AF1